MSNTAVGQVYKRVIDAVVESSKIDFEENGVNNEILEILREKWQDRLSHAQRALFPWDPQPEEQPSTPPRTITPDPEPVSEPAPAAASPAVENGANGQSDSQVKQEQPSVDNSSFLNLPQRNFSSGFGTQFATQRAAQLLQQQFGQQASGSIGALQAASMRQQTSGQEQSPQDDPLQDETTLVKQESSVQVKREQTEDSTLDQAQTDGAGDAAQQWTAVVVRRTAQDDHEPMGRLAVDGMIRRHVEQMAQRLEGGGLMVPLDERYPRHRKRRSAPASKGSNKDAASAVAGSIAPTAVNAESEAAAYKGGFDGPDDSDLDEDAINSDLDDPDETADNSIEGVYEGDVILCLYDKVQRVKNKWKCVLKDGVVTVDGKDYVFHKASGEFEW